MALKEEPITAQTRHEQRLKMTYQEFLEWADEDTHAEWVNGEVIVFMPPKNIHQRLLNFLTTVLNNFTQFFGLGELRFAPFEVKLAADISREPDVIFIARENLPRLSEHRVDGPPDLIVEIVSDDSLSRDRVDKFDEYEDAGVPEYWIIDNRPRRRRAEFYQMDENGRYQPVPVGKDGLYRSKVIPGFWLNVNWLWAEPPPDPFLTFAEIAGLPPEVVAQLRELKAQATHRE